MEIAEEIEALNLVNTEHVITLSGDKHTCWSRCYGRRDTVVYYGMYKETL